MWTVRRVNKYIQLSEEDKHCANIADESNIPPRLENKKRFVEFV